ncbi:hypothetical protein DACRYDRAFT_24193 [Dacryopinax primogenitus]|uniref:Uncharacterized protein n=1 Tax=Dacryopinax primogenitus (strain DJM 731) TaxID=1858805 RepID=M5G490_DACPD|nr:uncharacterized protein DACRYDRAFT_24193 [Dacryopinax primogenitus]EJT98567.1 hypothetical protein DACRYDRAFT_24193 [Dacryopinax primogenitus]
MESYDKLALDVFKQLVGEGYIPESAMMQQVEKVPTEAEGAPSISDAEHFTFVVIGTLVKMCLHYGYDQLAHDFMQSLQSTAMFDPVYRAAASKVIGTLLLSGTEKDAELLAGLVTSWAADVASVQPLRDDIIWLLYDFCHHVLRPDLIAFIHGRLSTPVLVDVYPVPQNHALVALLTELNHRNNIIQARNLIRTIFRNNYRVDPFHRANVIYQASQMGFATEARALYERYEHRAHSERVTGSAMLATELVAHFVRISEDQSQKLDKRAQDDARAFAQRVTSNLVASRAEMAKIPRTALNAIAHCHFLLGDLEAGFRTLRVILRRREVPHDNDVNVLLTAAAKYSPRAAVTLLKKALDDNYRASARAYAVLLHYARKSGDDELAEEVLRLAEDRGKMAHLDTTVKNSMIRTQLLPLISGVIQPPDTVRQALQTSFETMTWMKNQHRKVNDSLVHLAIRAAVANYRLSVAFAFWNDFFRGRVFEENDPWFSWEERLLVRIERAVQSGKLPRDKGFAMLNQLKENGITQGWVTDEEGLKREIMPFALPPLPAQEPDVGVQSGDEARSQQLPDHSADPVIPGDVADVDTMNDSLLQ